MNVKTFMGTRNMLVLYSSCKNNKKNKEEASINMSKIPSIDPFPLYQ